MSTAATREDTAIRDWLGLAGWLVASVVAAAIGGLATMSAGSFYQELDRPSWAPPSSVFGPVWTVLYLLMAVAAWLVWRERGFEGARTPLTLFIAQLAANALWSWLFFGWRMGAVAFVEVVVLWALVLATVITFWRVRPLAGLLLVPYRCGSVTPPRSRTRCCSEIRRYFPEPGGPVRTRVSGFGHP